MARKDHTTYRIRTLFSRVYASVKRRKLQVLLVYTYWRTTRSIFTCILMIGMGSLLSSTLVHESSHISVFMRRNKCMRTWLQSAYSFSLDPSFRYRSIWFTGRQPCNSLSLCIIKNLCNDRVVLLKYHLPTLSQLMCTIAWEKLIQVSFWWIFVNHGWFWERWCIHYKHVDLPSTNANGYVNPLSYSTEGIAICNTRSYRSRYSSHYFNLKGWVPPTPTLAGRFTQRHR